MDHSIPLYQMALLFFVPIFVFITGYEFIKDRLKNKSKKH